MTVQELQAAVLLLAAAVKALGAGQAGVTHATGPGGDVVSWPAIDAVITALGGTP